MLKINFVLCWWRARTNFRRPRDLKHRMNYEWPKIIFCYTHSYSNLGLGQYLQCSKCKPVTDFRSGLVFSSHLVSYSNHVA
jgi:hypothetical protein